MAEATPLQYRVGQVAIELTATHQHLLSELHQTAITTTIFDNHILDLSQRLCEALPEDLLDPMLYPVRDLFTTYFHESDVQTWTLADLGWGREVLEAYWFVAFALFHRSCSKSDDDQWEPFGRLTLMGGLAREAHRAGDYLALERLSQKLVQHWTDVLDRNQRFSEMGISEEVMYSVALLYLRIGDLTGAKSCVNTIKLWRSQVQKRVDVFLPHPEPAPPEHVDLQKATELLLDVASMSIDDRGPAMAKLLDAIASGFAASETSGHVQRQLKVCEEVFLTGLDLRTSMSQGDLGRAARNLSVTLKETGRKFPQHDDPTDNGRWITCFVMASLWSLDDDDAWSEPDLKELEVLLDGIADIGGLTIGGPRMPKEAPDLLSERGSELRVTLLLRHSLVALYADGLAELAFRKRWVDYQRLERRVELEIERATAFEGKNVADRAEELLMVRLRTALRRRDMSSLHDLRERVEEWLGTGGRGAKLGVVLPMRPTLTQLVVEYFMRTDRESTAWTSWIAEMRSRASEFRLGYFRSVPRTTRLSGGLVPADARDAHFLAVARYQASRILPGTPRYRIRSHHPPYVNAVRQSATRAVAEMTKGSASQWRDAAGSVVGLIRGTDHVLIVGGTIEAPQFKVADCSPGRWRKVTGPGRRGEKDVAEWLRAGFEMTGGRAVDDHKSIRLCVDPELFRHCRGSLTLDRRGTRLDDLGIWSLDPFLGSLDTLRAESLAFWSGIRSSRDSAELDRGELHVGMQAARDAHLPCGVVVVESDVDEVVSTWAHSKILHIAAHGELERGNPLFGYWRFGDDLRLSVGDLALQPASCGPIVILSNCHGADASIASGLGLGTGVLVAGAQASVAFRGEMRATAAKFMAILTRKIIQGVPIGVAAHDVRGMMRGLLNEPDQILQVFGDPLARHGTPS